MAVSASDIAKLKAAIRSGVTTVAYGDKRVEYRTLAEMRQILADMEAESAGRSRTKQLRVVAPANKGL